MEFNKMVNQIKELRKAKQDATELQARSRRLATRASIWPAGRPAPAPHHACPRPHACSWCLQEQSKAMKAGIKELEEEEKRLAAERDAALLPIGNLVPDSVPISDNEVRARHSVSPQMDGEAGAPHLRWHPSGATRRRRCRRRPAPARARAQDNNVVVKTFGEPRQEEKLYNHVDLVQARRAGPRRRCRCRCRLGARAAVLLPRGAAIAQQRPAHCRTWA